MNTQFNSNVIWLQLEYKISTLLKLVNYLRNYGTVFQLPYFLEKCSGTLTKLSISKVQMLLFYVLRLFEKGDTI